MVFTDNELRLEMASDVGGRIGRHVRVWIVHSELPSWRGPLMIRRIGEKLAKIVVNAQG